MAARRSTDHEVGLDGTGFRVLTDNHLWLNGSPDMSTIERGFGYTVHWIPAE